MNSLVLCQREPVDDETLSFSFVKFTEGKAANEDLPTLGPNEAEVTTGAFLYHLLSDTMTGATSLKFEHKPSLLHALTV